MASSITAITIKGVDLASKPIKGIGGALNNLGRTMSRLRYAALGLAAAFTGFGLSNEFIQVNSQLEGMTARLGSLLNNAQAGNEAFEWIRNFQKENPIRSIQEFGDSFEQLVAAGIDPTTGALKALTAGAAKFGLSAGDVAGVTRALKQMLAVSNLQKQELNQLSERIPGIQAKMAEALGMTTDKFIKQTTAMKVSSQDAAKAVLEILGENADEVIKRFSNTWDAGLTRLKTSWFALLASIGKTGIFDDLKKGLDDLNIFVQRLNSDVTTVGKNMRIAFTIVTNTIKNVGTSLDALFSGLAGGGSGFAWVMARINDSVSMISVAVTTVGELVRAVMGYFDDFDKRLFFIKRNLSKLSGGLVDDPLTEAVKNREKLVKKIGDLITAQGNSSLRLDSDAVKQESRKIQSEIESLSRSIRQYTAWMNGDEVKLFDDGFLDNMDGIISRWKDANSKIEAVQEGWKSSVANQSSNFAVVIDEDPFEQLKTSLGEVTKLNMDATDEVQSDWDKALKTIGDNFDKRFGDMSKTIVDFANGIDTALSRTFDKFFDDLINGHMPNLKNAISDFLGDILRMMIKMQTDQAAAGIANSIVNAVGSYFGGAGSSGVATTSPSSAGVGVQGPLQSNGQFKASSSPRVEIVNESGIPMQATSAKMKSDQGSEVMQVVIDSLARNKSGSRDALKGMMV